MKKIFAMLLAGLLILSFTACGNNNDENTDSEQNPSSAEMAADNDGFVLNSTEDVTVDYLIEATTPDLVAKTDAFKVTCTCESQSEIYYTKLETIYEIDGDISKVSDTTTYSNGDVTKTFFSNDKADLNYYLSGSDGNAVTPFEYDGFADYVFNNSTLNYSKDSVIIVSVEEKDGMYVAVADVNQGEGYKSVDTIYINPKDGHITKVDSSYADEENSEEDSVYYYEFDYSNGIKADDSAKTANRN